MLHIVSGPEGGGGPDGDDLRLVAGLRSQESWATNALIERYGPHVRRVLMRVLGSGESEQDDIVQDIFARAWQGIARLNDALALKGWLTTITVFTAREWIRQRRRRRWLSFFDSPPEVATVVASPDLQEATRCVYRIFERLPVDERIPFALRALEGMELSELASACGTSVATVRRRLASAERRFLKLAGQSEALSPWLKKERSR